MKRVDLAKAMWKNKNCIGFVWRFNNGKYGFQNDNDLGLDLEAISGKQPYVKKIYIGKYYVYQMRGGYEDTRGEGVSLKMALTLLKDMHSVLFTLTKQEQRLVDRYWGQF